MKIKNYKLKGFTLVEILVYLALFGVLMSGFFSAIFAITESASRNQTKALVQEEGFFILGKISWIMSGAVSIINPIVGCSVSCTSLKVKKWDNTEIIMFFDGTDLKMDGQNLNNQRIKVSDLIFKHFGSSINPEWVEVNFTLTSKISDGKEYSQDFMLNKYLKK